MSPSGGGQLLQVVVNQAEKDLPEVINDVGVITTSAIRTAHTAAQCARIGSLRIQAEFIHVCKKEGIDLEKSDEDLLKEMIAKLEEKEKN